MVQWLGLQAFNAESTGLIPGQETKISQAVGRAKTYLFYTFFKWTKVNVKVKSLSCVQLFASSWTVAYQSPQSMEFSRQEYWSGLPFPSPGDLPNPGIEPRSPTLQADALLSEPPGKSLTLKKITDKYIRTKQLKVSILTKNSWGEITGKIWQKSNYFCLLTKDVQCRCCIIHK